VAALTGVGPPPGGREAELPIRGMPASVTTFLLAGRWDAARARRGAGEAMREPAAGARSASVLADDGAERHVPAGELRPGGRLVARPGEVIAADGVVACGGSRREALPCPG
jgi:Cu+-exporting ATPase